MRRRLLPAGVAICAAVALAATPAAADSHDSAQLSVLHGVPDMTVDVYVDGERTLDDFEPGELAGPLELPDGTYSVAITAADAEDDSDPAIGPVDLELSGGSNYTAVAHLGEDGEPTATLFTNDTSETAAGEGRLTVRHVAAAPAVDILADDEAVVSDLSNPDEASLDLPAGTVSAAVAAAGTTDPVLGPADVEVSEGALTIVYAWGSLEAMERCGNRRPRVERLVSAWNQGTCGDADLAGEPDDPLIGASAEPKKRPRTRLTDEEVDAMRTARAQGVSVVAVARRFGVHRGTVWAKTRPARA